ncbi:MULTISPECIES: hypothetical protein [Cysteiniphilum]|uniref:Uncharacterized protein n=1 Tax=Cysteiniphilum litorale TaxID=2056700 RepID=A0A8J2Z3H8_9GAMM|nr:MULTISPECIES: hypothetical protein [Cysteiniphilum]GGF91327.1 hypothetical protein GCM10010995_05720 [Cysteiniphilum litorale]
MSKYTYEITLHYKILNHEARTYLITTKEPLQEIRKRYSDMQSLVEDLHQGCCDNDSYKRYDEEYQGDECAKIIEHKEISL